MSTQIDLVIFGARGDLANRKLFPALFWLDQAGLLADGVQIAAVARDDLDTSGFIEQTRQTLKPILERASSSEVTWHRFSQRLDYINVDFSEQSQFSRLANWINPDRTIIYYLATRNLSSSISQNLDQAGCLDEHARIVLEKPACAAFRQSHD